MFFLIFFVICKWGFKFNKLKKIKKKKIAKYGMQFIKNNKKKQRQLLLLVFLYNRSINYRKLR